MITKQNACHILILVAILFYFQNCTNHEAKSKFQQSKNLDETKNGYNVDGKKNGEWVSYFSDGNIQSICHFKNGVAHGSVIVYNEKGQELYRGNFSNGIKIGEWVFTDPITMKKTVKKYKD